MGPHTLTDSEALLCVAALRCYNAVLASLPSIAKVYPGIHADVTLYILRLQVCVWYYPGAQCLGSTGHSKPGQQAKHAAGAPDPPAPLETGFPSDTHITCLLAEASAVTG